MGPLRASCHPRALLAVVAATAGLAGCAGAAPAAPARDLVLVTIDTLRWDATGYSGAGRADTPILDRLARDGTAFREAHAHAVVTLASHASILTGLYPSTHGVHDNAGFRLDPSHATLAARLRGAGFATGAFVSAFVLDRRFGLAPGFDEYDDDAPQRSGREFLVPERDGDETVARAARWWSAHADRRRFLWVHLFAPHFPYDPPEPYRSRYAGRPYFGEVALADAQLGRLLAALAPHGAAAPAVIVTADHGESLGEHGEETHGLFAYESTLRVPLVIDAPGRKDADPRAPARHVDIVPTALALLGLPRAPGLPGRDLFSVAARHAPRDSYFEALSAYYNRGGAPLTGRIEGAYKALRLPLPELYDLDADPGETRNLVDGRRAGWAALVAAVPQPPSRAPVTEDDDARVRLAALGYVGGGRAPSPAAPGAPAAFDASSDPKSLVRHEGTLDRALSLYAAGRAREAEATLAALVEAQPRLTLAYLHLAFFAADQGRLADAIRVLERALARGAGTESVRRALALDLVRAGQAARAEAVLAPDRESHDPDTRLALGRVAAALGRPEAARAQFLRVLADDPRCAEADADLGVLALSEGRLDEARARLDRALARNPRHADAWNARGVVAARDGELGRALDAWSRAVASDPALADAWFNIAVVAARGGDRDRAEAALARYIPLSTGAERARARALLARLRGAGGPS